MKLINTTVSYYKDNSNELHTGKLLSFNRDFTANIEEMDCGLFSVVDAYNIEAPFADVVASFKADKPYNR